MPRSTRYRMYVDESGDHVMDPSKWSSPDARYLGLTGVVIASETYRTRTHPEFEALKQEFFPHEPDYPVILVRNRIAKREGPFRSLSDPQVAANWEQQIIRFMSDNVSQIFTVVIDKQEHWNRYGRSALHPYNQCATALTEIYGQWLRTAGGQGDVLAESRSGTADRELKKAFRELMEAGGPSVSVEELQSRITSKEIKLRPKEANITGLQLADLVVYPTTRDILQEWGRPLLNQPSHATRRITEALRQTHSQQERVLLP